MSNNEPDDMRCYDNNERSPYYKGRGISIIEPPDDEYEEDEGM